MGAKGDEGLALLLRERRSRGKSMRYCVVGAGNGGLAMAGHLGLMGFPTALYNRTAAKLEAVRWHGGVRIEGAAAGFGRVDLATSDMAEALEGVDLVMVVTPSTAHRELAAQIGRAHV